MTVRTGTYLDQIVDDVRRRLRQEPDMPVAAAADGTATGARSLVARIAAARTRGELAIVAEVKRRSPSVGAIAPDADPVSRAMDYESGGAAGISVLTEPDHFGGSLGDLAAVRACTRDAAVLRKDFIVEDRQLLAACSVGADAVLLIAALHGDGELRRLTSRAIDLGMEVLLEVHDERELASALATDARMIGINNRDLRSFTVDLATTERLAPLVPDDRVIVAESGVRSVEDAIRLRAAGVDAILVGEALMRVDEPALLLRQLATAGQAGVTQ